MQRNTELFNKIADAIEAAPHRYNQRRYGAPDSYDPAAPRSIGGWAIALSGATPLPFYGYERVMYWGAERTFKHLTMELLGLTVDEALALCSPNWLPSEVGVIEELRAIGRGKRIDRSRMWG